MKKFHPMIKGKSPENSFEEVKKELVKALELASLEKADDIIDSVRDMKKVDLDAIKPTLKVSSKKDDEKKEVENAIYKEEYRYEMKKWDSRVDALANNQRKLHAKILKFCSEPMEEKLEGESNIETTLYKDPIVLLKRIRKFMTTSKDTNWEYFKLWESMKRLMNCHQVETKHQMHFKNKLKKTHKQYRHC